MKRELSPRQIECVRLSADMTDFEIARVLGISPGTVNKHITEALHRLEVGDRRAARRALGFTTPSPTDPIPQPAGSRTERPVADEADGRGRDTGVLYPETHPPARFRFSVGRYRTPQEWAGSRSALIIVGAFVMLLLVSTAMSLLLLLNNFSSALK